MNVSKLPVHPAADVFPMLDADELEELAEDIKANGLNHPIVIGKHDGKTVLVDGRNRREACRIAGVEPEVVELNGKDPVAFIISENIRRRHMSAGQRAMTVAKLYPEADEAGRGKKSVRHEQFSDVAGSSVRKARTVLSHAPDLADSVLSGARSLDECYKVAQERKRNADSDESKLQKLKAEAPDLAARVVEDGASLSEQLAAFEQRKRDEAEQRRNVLVSAFSALAKIHENITAFDSSDFRVADYRNDAAYSELVRRYFVRLSKAQLVKRARVVGALLEEIGHEGRA